MMKSKWSSLENSRKYRLEDLGRPAFFLIPTSKLKKRVGTKTVDEILQEFLSRHFRGFRFSSRSDFGAWINDQQVIVKEKCREYEVSFPGKRGIRLLLEKLAEIASKIDEECIYFKAGQYSCLVYPPKKFKVIKNGKVIESPLPGKYAGYRPRKIFGRLDCKSGMKMRKENRVFFLTWNDAIKSGYRPCKKCKPEP